MHTHRALIALLLLPFLASCNAQQFAQKKAPPSTTPLETILSSQNGKDIKPVALKPGDEKKDREVCLSRGLTPGEETYYQCRAQLMRDRATANESPLKKLTPAQRGQYTTWEAKAEQFETKAKEAYKTQITTTHTSRDAWEAAEAKKIQAAQPADHKACLRKGFSLGKMENPNTEAYFDCRAVLAAQHASPPPPETQYNANQLPVAVLEFYRKAEEARQVFNERDYQDHYACLDKGLFPGEWENPNTAEYYRCRASLAGNGLGKDVKSLFQEDVARASKEAEENHACASRHFEKGMPEYEPCRKSYASFKQCKEGIRPQVMAREAHDRRDCNQKAALEFPSRLSEEKITEFTKVTSAYKEVRSKRVEPARYTLQELDNVRATTVTMCMRDREVMRVQYRMQLESQCKQVMDNIGRQSF